jgi:hypothetical protein
MVTWGEAVARPGNLSKDSVWLEWKSHLLEVRFPFSKGAMLCRWSNLLSCVDSLATVGGPVVVVTPIRSPPSPLIFLHFSFT